MSKKSPTTGEKKLKTSKYEKTLRKLQDWLKHKGLGVIVVFKGRDGAGKGGPIRAP